ncbi:MAG: hypothetical protein P4L28_07325 [Paludibacteraceae bacterium]|nr:hypothetical protein [Paludibacteraceae bacterium]
MDINDGINQHERSSFLVQDDFLKIDELSFHELVCYARDFAKKINYFNLQNQQEGNWDALLSTDEIVVIAEILALNISEIEKEFIDTIKPNFNTLKEYSIRKSNTIFKLVQLVDSWYKRFKVIDNFQIDGLFKITDELIRTKLTDEFHNLLEILQHQNILDFTNIDSLSSIWRLDLIKESSTLPDEKHITNQFSTTFYAFFNTINYLKQISPDYLAKSLRNQSHAPHLSLFFTFLKLYSNIRQETNAFPQKYFRFYYDEILKIEPKKYYPDSTFLLFSLKEGFDNFLIPRGTRFLAGKDDTNKNLYYSADCDTVINKAKIGRIHTFYQENNKLIYPECDCTGLFVDEIPCSAIEDFKPGSTNNWPLFGGVTSPGKKNADLGFIISDNNLLLLEGKRNVTVNISFTEKSCAEFKSKLDKLNENSQQEEILINLFSNIFSIYATTDGGWFKINSYNFKCSLANNSSESDSFQFNIQFNLAVADPAISGYNSDIHGYDLADGIPALKFIINNESYLFPYTLIRDLELEKIETSVRANGLNNILIYNELGKIDTTKSFFPFGVIPQINSSFILGNYELSRKKISKLDILIKWNNLPDNENGLQDYFSDYNENISKSDYKCNITWLNNGYWVPKEKAMQQQVNLFTANSLHNNEPKEKLIPVSAFSNINTLYFQVDKRKAGITDFDYNKNTLGGFVKISLSNPPFAFGYNKYPECIIKITKENAKRKVPKPLPNAPLSPMAEGLTLNYASTSVIEFSDKKKPDKEPTKQFYHIHPWGYQEIQQSSITEKIKLAPCYTQHGNLLIGMQDAQPNMTVSIFFNLLNDSVFEENDKLPEISWEYLASNQWTPLPKLNLLSDSTTNFLKSGIITMLLPADINKENTLLSNEYHWLKISAEGHLASICNVINISTQAIKVTWQNDGNSLSHLGKPLPLGTIAKSEIALLGIKTILQPVNSFGGKPLENTEHGKIRMGERLIHKNRAVTTWDYERLILENFPNIYKVKCFPHMSSDEPCSPGNILIAVICKIEKDNLRIDYEPMVNQLTLHKIKALVSGMASPFANIEVRNPCFERLQVRCAVKFKKGLDAGYFINKLNEAIIDYLTPWQTNGGNEPGFGKVIKCSDVLSFIQSLDFVDYATDFSMLQVSRDTHRKYHIKDTGKYTRIEYNEDSEEDTETDIDRKILKPTHPWGILISAEKHAIEIMNEKKEIEPEKTGIAELGIGETFIIK